MAFVKYLHAQTQWFVKSERKYTFAVLIIVQRDATQSSLFIILQVRSTCFGCQSHPSSGVHKTVTTASGTGHIFCAATSPWPHWRAVAAPVPEAVVTVQEYTKL